MITKKAKWIPLAAVSAASLALTVACSKSDQGAQAPVGRNSQVMAVDTPPPEYPLRQACDGIGGIVELEVTVGTTGSVTDSKVRKSSQVPELDAAAQAATLKYKFEPAYVNGNPIVKKILVPVNFRAPENHPSCKKS